ncbi:MAG: hypothetical protein COA99_00655 [Moraxellaceae bacterium]|nr:MAG: hypothetical protein COA99_00655 [Moraxellaceae bacterium]
MSNKKKLYMNIAKACLNAINQTSKETTDEAYDKVFEAIDTAFTEQYGVLGSDYQNIRHSLETIANLSEEEACKAPSLAKLALMPTH